MEEKIASTPKYTPNQELANSISHAFGAFLALLGFPFLIVKAAYTGDPWSVVACSLFFFGMMMTYVGSAIYHGLKPSKAKDVWRILDHCNIFLLIIGSYSPYCLVSLRETYPAWGWSIYGIVVGLGILGIVLNAVSLKTFKVFSMINYLLMGWIIIISFFKICLQVQLCLCIKIHLAFLSAFAKDHAFSGFKIYVSYIKIYKFTYSYTSRIE